MQLSQRKELAAACEKQEALLQALFARYPAGLPSAEEIRRQREHFLDAQQACRRLGELTLCDEDREIVARAKKAYLRTGRKRSRSWTNARGSARSWESCRRSFRRSCCPKRQND